MMILRPIWHYFNEIDAALNKATHPTENQQIESSNQNEILLGAQFFYLQHTYSVCGVHINKPK
jgi:hypothetical protein